MRIRVCGTCSQRPTWICRHCRDNNGFDYCCWECWPDGQPPNPNPPAPMAGGGKAAGHLIAEGTDPLWQDIAPCYVERWGGLNDSALALVGRATRLTNVTPGAGFTAQLSVRYRREGTALQAPDLVTARTQVVFTRREGKLRAGFCGTQIWPIPDSAELAESINAGNLPGPMSSSNNPYEEKEHVLKLRIALDGGDNHVMFLSRLYALLHAAAVVAATGGRWEQKSVVEGPQVFAAENNWVNLLTSSTEVVVLSDLWTVAARQVIMIAAASDWPVTARLPGSAQQPTTLSWGLPEGYRFRVFSHQVTPVPVQADAANVLSVSSVMAAIDAYVSMYRLQTQWQYVVNRGTLGVYPLSGNGPELPRPIHASEVLYPFWEAGIGGAGSPVALPVFISANPARGVLAHAMVTRTVKHSLTWTLHEFGIQSASQSQHGVNATSCNNQGPLAYPALGLGLGNIVLGQVARGGTIVAGMVAKAAPDSVKPLYSALGPRRTAMLMMDATYEGALEAPLPMAPFEWAMLGVSSADPGCSVLEECTFQGLSLAGASEMATALEISKMALLGVTRNAGFVPEFGPDLPIDVHTLAPLPIRALESRVARSYLAGKTLKLVPEVIEAEGVEWSTPVDMDLGELLPSWTRVTPTGPREALEDAVAQVGLDGPASVSDCDVAEPDVTLANADDPPAPVAFGANNLPDADLRTAFPTVRDIAAGHPERVAIAPPMDVTRVPGNGQCAAHALARSAKMQSLDAELQNPYFWIKAAAAAGLSETELHGWWDDRVMTAVTNERVTAAWYDESTEQITSHGTAKACVYYTLRDQHFFAAAPRVNGETVTEEGDGDETLAIEPDLLNGAAPMKQC